MQNVTLQQKWTLIELLILLLAFLAGDLGTDLLHGVSRTHVVVQLSAGFASAFGIFTIWRRRIAPLRASSALPPADQPTPFLNPGTLSEVIDRQFRAWGLTPAEKETALLLLKGLSCREIAKCRSVTEKTVKQQNLSIYYKAKIRGRAELAAFFLEDLLADSKVGN